MKKTFALVALGAAFLCYGCGGDSHESLNDETCDIFTEMTEIMATITDEASAKEAAPKIEALAVEFKDIVQREKSLGDPPDDVKRELEKKMSAAMQDFFKEMMRVGQVEGAMKQIEKAMEGVGPR